MRYLKMFTTGLFAWLAVSVVPAHAQEVTVALTNLGTQAETGEGTAVVNLVRGTVDVRVDGLRLVPHDNPLGAGRILGYAAWLVNSEDALKKINLGFLFPAGGGISRLSFSAPQSQRVNLVPFEFNQVLITAETELDLHRSQPSGPPIAAGHIPGTPAVLTPPPAVEVLMGKLDDDVFGFLPKTVTIFSGQTIRWTNVSPEFIIPHTATRTDAFDGTTFGAGQEFNSEPVPFGQSFTHTFTLPPTVPAGVFNYHCIPHAELAPLGMTGRIVVIGVPTTFTVPLSGAQEVPPVTTTASGTGTLTFNPANRLITYDVTTTGLTGTAAHIHQAPAGVNGPIIVGLQGGPTRWSGTATLTPEQATALFAGELYFNVHTAGNPGGELRGQIR